jgi:hypothetical protein
MGNSGGSSEDLDSDKHGTVKIDHKVSSGNEDLVDIRLEAIRVTFWQRICLHLSMS